MDLLLIGNLIAWGLAAIICAYTARKKGKNTRLALLLGILFGALSMIYYLFCKSKKDKWKKKYSWFILGSYILSIIFLVLLEFLSRRI